MKKIFKILIIVYASIFWACYGIYYFYVHTILWALPSKEDFTKHEKEYMEVINLLNTETFKEVLSVWWKWITLKNNDYCTIDRNNCLEKYLGLIGKVSQLDDDASFSVCPGGIIKIEKWWLINNYYEVTYVYSVLGFKIIPSLMVAQINDKIIIHHNYEGHDYSADYYCRLQ